FLRRRSTSSCRAGGSCGSRCRGASMTRRRWPSTFADRTVAVGVALAAAWVGVPRTAAAQACCAGGALIAPTRLAEYEDVAVGLESRTQGVLGVFGADGRYAGSSSGEHVFEQNLAASVRVTRAAQAGLMLRAMQTHRSVAGVDEWGGGVGDLSASARYDFLLPADRPRLPGIAVLAGATFPTGRPADAATQPLATDATGAGSYDVSLGVGVEKAFRHVLAGVSAWGTY